MATTEAQPRQGELAAAERIVRPRREWAADAVRPLAGVRPSADLISVTFLMLAAAVVHWPTLAGVGLYGRSDTFTFFYPVFATLHQSLRDGELPLWTPHIFGGFPLFAEGQTGALYPPSLLAAVLPSPVAGFLALRVFHVLVALLGAYALARCLGVSAVGSSIAGLVFGFGSFLVGQQHHGSLLAAAVWLPLLLLCVELALRRAAWSSNVYIALAALIVGMQALASHVQPLLLSCALLFLYVPVRQVCKVRTLWFRARSSTKRRQAVAGPLKWAAWSLVAVPLLGAALGAIQLIPLYELSRESWRAAHWSYQDAIEYSFPPINLITVVFPSFFRAPGGGYWSLWQGWEVVLYVGVAPLLLALAALIFVRRWSVLLFGIVALSSGFLALGVYAPFGVYEALWNLPGMSYQRAPARFTLLTVLALALLAAHGADWLTGRGGRLPAPRPRQLALAHVALLLVLAVVLAHMIVWRSWLHAEQWWALRVLSDSYLRLAHDPLQMLTPIKVLAALEASLDIANPRTAFALVLLAACAALVLARRELPRFRRAWQGALLLLVTLDLLVFASDFHPLLAANRLAEVTQPGQFLAANAGPWRSLTRPEVESTRPNRLLPTQVSEVGGYSPLQLDRHVWFGSAVQTVDNTLLDAWNVRYVVTPAAVPSLPSYQHVAYHPRRPMMIGGAGTPNGRLSLAIPMDKASELRMIATLAEGAGIHDGEVVGEWTLTDAEGIRHVVPVRAGREVADWTVAETLARTAHRPVQTATIVPSLDPASGTERPRALSYAAISLPRRLTVTRAEYRHVHREGRSLIYGVGLVDGESGHVGQFYRPEKYAVAYSDDEVVILENRAHFPRAFVVPEAIHVPDGPSALARVTDGAVDVSRQIVLESSPDTAGATDATSWSRAAARAEVLEERAQSLTVRASSPSDGYLVLSDAHYPGWRAFVDGSEVPIFRANYLFRAIALPGGDHDVTFIFDPASFRIGALVSLVGVLVIAALFAAAMRGPWLLDRLRRRRQMA